jgi:MYXO-CTERM domain-containing protein
MLASCGVDAPAVDSVHEGLQSCAVDADCPTSGLGACMAQNCGPSHFCFPVSKPNCCTVGTNRPECDDNNACTEDDCTPSIPMSGNVCNNTVLNIVGCCTANAQCTTPSTSCQNGAGICVQGSCTYTANMNAGCCNGPSDCGAAGNFTCVNSVCGCSEFESRYCPGAGFGQGACGQCCSANDCPTGNSCQARTCNSNQCGLTSNGSAGCCNGVIDCPPPGNMCQAISCTNNQCSIRSSGGSGCCNTAGDCTPNSCQIASCSANTCSYKAKTGVAGCCTSPSDCPKSPCAVATCVNNTCGNMPQACSDMATPPDLATASADLATASADLATSSTDLATSSGDLATANADLATSGRDAVATSDLLAAPSDGMGAPDAAAGDMSASDMSAILVPVFPAGHRVGGCSLAPGGAARPTGLALVALLLFARRRRRAPSAARPA